MFSQEMSPGLVSSTFPDGLKERTVLHVGKFYPPHAGGMENHLQTLCHQLSPHLNVRALVFANGRRTRERADGAVRLTEVGCWATLMSAPISARIFAEVRRTEADLIHVHWPNPAAALAYLVAGRKRPLVITWHSDVIRQKRVSRGFDFILRRFVASARRIIVSSPRYAEGSPALSASDPRIRVIPFGIDPDAYTRCDQARVREIRRCFGPRIVLAVGRLVYYKGFEFLIRAMRRVPDSTLVVIGKGPLRSALADEASRAGIRERVVFIGAVKDLLPFYHACDVFVLPSIARTEAFGIVQLEAMAAGRPVVNTALNSGVPYVSLDGLTGVTVPPGDSDALAGAISQLLDDHAMRTACGYAAARRVREEFNLDLMTQRTLEVYREALEIDRAWPKRREAHLSAA